MSSSSKMTNLPPSVCRRVAAGYKTKRPTSKPSQPPKSDNQAN
ncbi:hypothetical protein [Pseudoalteromonas luteoviolacea]|nr:hypothetical protein [Pseudoalteromonas luteoviolacea]